jgi:hypothetical protein
VLYSNSGWIREKLNTEDVVAAKAIESDDIRETTIALRERDVRFNARPCDIPIEHPGRLAVRLVLGAAAWECGAGGPDWL